MTPQPIRDGWMACKHLIDGNAPSSLTVGRANAPPLPLRASSDLSLPACVDRREINRDVPQKSQDW